MIYLDHNATTPMLPEVLEAMLPYFKADWGKDLPAGDKEASLYAKDLSSGDKEASLYARTPPAGRGVFYLEFPKAGFPSQIIR